MKNTLLSAVVLAAFATFASADTVVLKDGSKLTGTIGTVSATSVDFESTALGKIKIDSVNVESFSFDKPVTVQPANAPAVTGAATGTGTAVTVDGKQYNLSDIKGVNASGSVWSGTVVANGALARGNTNNFTAGVDALAALRRNDDKEDDRTTFTAGYQFAKSGKGETGSTTTDNWYGSGKYDKFWDPKFYTYGAFKVEHDRIANLQYRLSPQIGLGYQFWESQISNLSGEAGIGYIYERYDVGADKKSDYINFRLAYHYDRKLNDDVTFIHNVEWLPAFKDPGDYVLTADAGIKAQLTDKMFSEFKIVFKRDSNPAENALKNDLLYTIGIGWDF